MGEKASNLFQSKVLHKYSMRDSPNFDRISLLSFAKEDEDLLTLYILGIGVYSKETRVKYPDYAQLIADLAARGHLPLLYADSELAYGINFMISQIYVTDDARQALLQPSSSC